MKHAFLFVHINREIPVWFAIFNISFMRSSITLMVFMKGNAGRNGRTL
ncbi:hypothetical protein C823_001258 [Eubacterium plexicaudatum ASF492]|nr:hypothetical protein C823_001258 [Eubacterium plexicaudatum ASF492]